MAVLEVQCNNQSLEWVKDPAEMCAGNIKIDSIAFNFCELWDGFEKTAVFYRDKNKAINVLLDDTNACDIPPEMTEDKGLVYIGVFGIKGGCRRATAPKSFYLKEGILTNGKPSEPTPDIYQQIISLYAEAKETAARAEETAKEAVDIANGAKATAGNAEEIAKSVRTDADNGEFDGKDGYTPIKGKDYFDGKDGHTPVNGVDYNTPEEKAETKAYIDKSVNEAAEGKADKEEWKLINEVELTEDAVVEFTADADGNAFNLKKFKVTVLMPKLETQSQVWLSVFTSSYFLAVYSGSIPTNANTPALSIVGELTYAWQFETCCSRSGLSNSGTVTSFPRGSRNTTDITGLVSKVKLGFNSGMTTPLPAGSKIKLWGCE